jgi:hypothetical protein
LGHQRPGAGHTQLVHVKHPRSSLYTASSGMRHIRVYSQAAIPRWASYVRLGSQAAIRPPPKTIRSAVLPEGRSFRVSAKVGLRTNHVIAAQREPSRCGSMGGSRIRLAHDLRRAAGPITSRRQVSAN